MRGDAAGCQASFNARMAARPRESVLVQRELEVFHGQIGQQPDEAEPPQPVISEHALQSGCALPLLIPHVLEASSLEVKSNFSLEHARCDSLTRERSSRGQETAAALRGSF
jgi:hypothetical protein